MAEYIEREQVKAELLSWAVCIKHPEHLLKEDALCVIDAIPAADVVPVGVLGQIRWERDTAMQQLEEHGIPFCGKADVVPVVRCGECKYFHNLTCKIRKGSWGEQLKVGFTDFCSDGERRADNG